MSTAASFLATDAATAPLVVSTEVGAVPFVAPLEAFFALRARWGQDVVLLESLAGPRQDTRASLIAFDPLLSLTLTRSGAGRILALHGKTAALEGLAARLGVSVEASALRPGASAATLTLGHEREIWELLRQIQRCFHAPAFEGRGFRFGFAGYLGYDLARSIEALPERIAEAEPLPLLSLTIFQGVLTFDLHRQKAELVTHGLPGLVAPPPTTGIGELLHTLAKREQERPEAAALPAVPAPRAVRGTLGREAYLEKVARALHHVSVGDIYQVQLGHEILVESEAEPLDVYRRLRRRNASPYMYFLPAGEVTLIGASPEAFVQIEGRHLAMRPIAGTAKRGGSAEEDADLVQRLANDEKELAEHIMLVDLCRNDVGRVSEPRSLRTPELLVVEQYSHVNHLVSHVTGTLRRGADVYDAIVAGFPAGTMTGAPKIRAMELIEELEVTRRGAYAGAVGLIDFGGDVNLALCIRSAAHRKGVYSLRASAGTVADSQAENEWRETLHKMAAGYWAVTGEELTDESLLG